MRFRRQIVCASGEPRTRATDQWTKWLVAFWFQAPEGKRVRRNMKVQPTPVGDAQPFELQALADGALLEVMANFQFPLAMPMAKRRDIIDSEWREQHLKRLGFLPETLTLVGGPVAAPGALEGDRSARA